MRMGIQRVLTTDNGSEVKNELDTRLSKALGIKRFCTFPYHPLVSLHSISQFCSCLTLHTLSFTLTGQWTWWSVQPKFISGKKDTWDDFLDACIYAYNTSVHESTSFTPFEVMYIANDAGPFMADIVWLSEKRLKTPAMVKEHIQQAQKKQKNAHKRKHALCNSFSVGDLVF